MTNNTTTPSLGHRAQPVDLLLSVMDQASSTLHDLFALLDDSDGQPTPTTSELLQLVNRLKHQITAAHELSVVVPGKSIGWPTEVECLASIDGPRSGYPADLVSGLLMQAVAAVVMIRSAVLQGTKPTARTDKLPGIVTDGTLNTALWGVSTSLALIVNVIEYKGKPSTQLAAA